VKLLLENWRKYLKEEGGFGQGSAPKGEWYKKQTIVVEEEKPKVNIFLDMDGVLVDFPSALKEYIKSVYSMDSQELHPGSKSSRAAFRKLQRMNLSPEEIDELYDRSEYNFQSGASYDPDEKIMSDYVFKALLENKELWLTMNKLEGADTLVETAFALADEVFVLTAHVDQTSADAKKEWISQHFPQIDPAKVNVDQDKGGRLLQLISQGTVAENDLNILIDDRQKFLNSFIEAGGTGIQYNFESPQNAIDELKAVIGN
jgi:5'(3')-deoxyribonucleotidase